MIVVQDSLTLCDDCMIGCINDDFTGIHEDAQAERIAAACHAMPFGLVPDFDSETGRNVDTFSAAECDCCHTRLAGGRYGFAALGEGGVAS